MSQETDPSNSETTFTYDALNRITFERVDDVVRGRWLYDPADNLGLERQNQQRLTNGEGWVQEFFFYDGWGRLTQERSWLPNPNPNSTGRLNFSSFYEYRDDGQVSSIRHPSGTGSQADYEVDYTYNTRTGQQIGLDETAASGGETIVSGVEWNQAGQLIQQRFGSGDLDPVATWHYDSGSLRLVHDRFGTNNILGLDRLTWYEFDGVGNIETIRDSRVGDHWQCFEYDQVDRLTRAYTEDGAQCDGYTPTGNGDYHDAFNFDKGGNITFRFNQGAGSTGGTYTYGDAGLAHAVTRIAAGASVSTFVYDDNGNMTSRDLAGQAAQTLQWDEGRRLEEVRVGNTVEAEFLYAIDDRRVRRIADGVTTYYLADGTEYTIDGANSYFTYFHSVNGRMVAFTKSDTDVTTWMGADIVNSTSNTRDENGVTAQQRYTPFGEVRIDGNLATDHTYTGQVNDETTGLAFYNARYYDPATARFITPDSIVPNPNDGQDYNRYSYVRNNPVKYSDPTGNEPCRQFGTCIEGTGFDGDIQGIIAANNEARRPQLLPNPGRQLRPNVNPGIPSFTKNGASSTYAGGTFDPIDGGGTVRINLFIPDNQIDSFGLPTFGDDRGPDPTAGIESSRAVLVLDLDRGVAIAAFAPSCQPGRVFKGVSCDDAFPTSIVVGDGLGFDDIDTQNGFAISQSGRELTVHIEGLISVGPPVSPAINGIVALSVDGSGNVSVTKRGDGFPAYEVYQDSNGQTELLGFFEEGTPLRLLGDGQ